MCATESPACCSRTCPITLRKNMTPVNLVSRDIQSTRCHATSTFAKQVSKQVAPGPLCNCSAFIAMSTKCPTFGTTPKHVASCGYVEKQDKFASIFWSDLHPHVMGNVTLTRISSSFLLPSRSQDRKGIVDSALRKLLMSWSVRRLHVMTQRVVQRVSNVASRCCDTQMFMVRLSVGHAA